MWGRRAGARPLRDDGMGVLPACMAAMQSWPVGAAVWKHRCSGWVLQMRGEESQQVADCGRLPLTQSAAYDAARGGPQQVQCALHASMARHECVRVRGGERGSDGIDASVSLCNGVLLRFCEEAAVALPATSAPRAHRGSPTSITVQSRCRPAQLKAAADGGPLPVFQGVQRPQLPTLWQAH